MKKEQEEYYQELLAEQNRLMEMIQLKEGDRFELSTQTQSGDEADRSLMGNLRELAISLGDADRQRLRLVQEALARLDEGAYGDCLNCEMPISYRRLRVLPWTPYCIRCQQQVEEGLIEESYAEES